MYLMRELLGMQLVEIGTTFGGRDHSTVIHSLERVGEMIGEDPTFEERVKRLHATLEKLRT
jgi:chromosomal replication initiator protein